MTPKERHWTLNILGIIAFGLVVGLVVGLVSGLVSGLAFGLVSGLVSGLAFGLASGIVSGLVVGLAFGLVVGLAVILTNFSEALPFISGIKEILLVVLLIIILAEIWFWLDKSKPKNKENKFRFTLKKKLLSIFEVSLFLSGITTIYVLIREIEIPFEIVLKWIGYIGVGIIGLGIIVGLFYLWIKLNSLKYEK